MAMRISEIEMKGAMMPLSPAAFIKVLLDFDTGFSQLSPMLVCPMDSGAKWLLVLTNVILARKGKKA